MAKPPVLAGKKLERARAMLAKGKTVTEVAAKLGVSRRPVSDLKAGRLAYAK